MIHECDLMTNTDFNKTENLSKDALEQTNNMQRTAYKNVKTLQNWQPQNFSNHSTDIWKESTSLTVIL